VTDHEVALRWIYRNIARIYDFLPYLSKAHAESIMSIIDTIRDRIEKEGVIKDEDWEDDEWGSI